MYIFLLYILILIFPFVSYAQESTLSHTDLELRQYLKSIRKGVLESSKLVLTYSGEFVEFDNKPGIAPTTNVKYDARFRFKSSDNKYQSVFFLNEGPIPVIKKLQVVQREQDGSEKPITLQDLKAGDKILYERIYNLIGSTDIVAESIRIIKL